MYLNIYIYIYISEYIYIYNNLEFWAWEIAGAKCPYTYVRIKRKTLSVL